MTDSLERDFTEISIPSELPILPLQCDDFSISPLVIFPHQLVPLKIFPGPSLQLVAECLSNNHLLGVVAQKNSEESNPDPTTLFSRGCAVRIVQTLKSQDGTTRILVQGLQRIEIAEYLQREPYLRARIGVPPQPCDLLPEEQNALREQLSQLLVTFTFMAPYLPVEFMEVAKRTRDLGKLTDLAATLLKITFVEKQNLLNTSNVRARAEQLSVILRREIEQIGSQQKIKPQGGAW